MFKKALALLTFASAAFGQAPQTTPPYGEKVDVNLVMLDTIVTDRGGHQILGLDKDDFIVTENGVQQTIDSVEYFTNRKLLTSPESKAAFKSERLRDDRYYIIFFDKPSNAQLFDRLVLARNGALDFVNKQMKPGDLVAVAGHDVRLKIYSDFTSDKAQLRKAINESALYGKGLTTPSAEPGPSILRNLSSSEIVDNTGTVYEAIGALGEAVRPIHARKELIVFSAGIVAPDEDVRGEMVIHQSRYYDPMIRALNEGNVAVYAINLFDDPNAPPFIHQNLARMATETNGDYFRFNTSFTPALHKIENLTNGYYLISYYTKRASDAHGFQKVSVTTRNPEFKVKARQGYSID